MSRPPRVRPDWELAGAIDDYLAGQPRACRILAIGGEYYGAPQWWCGMQVLAWDA